MLCPFCKSEIADDAVVCPHCRAEYGVQIGGDVHPKSRIKVTFAISGVIALVCIYIFLDIHAYGDGVIIGSMLAVLGAVPIFLRSAFGMIQKEKWWR